MRNQTDGIEKSFSSRLQNATISMNRRKMIPSLSSGIFRPADHLGLQDFQDEEIVDFHQAGIGNPAFQICEAFQDRRGGYFCPRHRSEAKLFEFIDFVP